jgi:hypothetical protein
LPILDVFRNRYFTQTHLKELDKYLKNITPKGDFSKAKYFLKTIEELGTDNNLFN